MSNDIKHNYGMDIKLFTERISFGKLSIKTTKRKYTKLLAVISRG
jgi:hypothetical protein